MAKSRYDSDHDGFCDSKWCKNVLFFTTSDPPEVDTIPELFRDLAAIGLQLKYREMAIDDCGPFVQTVRNLIPVSICSIPEAVAMSPETFAMQFDPRGIRCEGEVNTSELGMTRQQARKCGVEEQYASANRPPSADAEIARCSTLTGPGRRSCWIQLDEDLMTRYVPWAPFLWSRSTTLTAPTVLDYDFDQFSGTISFSHIAVNNGVDPESLTP
jgi:hypothetical protein